MKNFVFSAIAALGLSTAAFAGDLDFVGETEYAIEAEVLSFEAGGEYTHDMFRLTGVTQFDTNNIDDDIEFTGVELEAGYTLTENVEAYVRLETDDDLSYDEAVVGASFRF